MTFFLAYCSYNIWGAVDTQVALWTCGSTRRGQGVLPAEQGEYLCGVWDGGELRQEEHCPSWVQKVPRSNHWLNHMTVFVHSSCWEIGHGNQTRLGCVKDFLLHHAFVINPGYSDLSSSFFFFTSPDCFRQSLRNTCHMTCCWCALCVTRWPVFTTLGLNRR